MTAAQIIDMVRDLINERGSQVAYRDGFAADSGEVAGSKSILSAINIAQRKLAITGYAREYIDVPTVASPRTPEYTLAYKVLRVLSVVLISGSNVYETHEADYRKLDFMRARWRVAPVGRPIEWYQLTRKLGFNPAPDAIYTAQTHCAVTDVDLTLTSSIPLLLPEYYHPALAYGGAWELMVAEVENPSAQARVPYLQGKYEGYFKELQALARMSGVDLIAEIQPGDIGKLVQR